MYFRHTSISRIESRLIVEVVVGEVSILATLREHVFQIQDNQPLNDFTGIKYTILSMQTGSTGLPTMHFFTSICLRVEAI